MLLPQVRFLRQKTIPYVDFTRYTLENNISQFGCIRGKFNADASFISQSFKKNNPNVGISSGTSRSWSGYGTTSGTFTSVSGTWTIPSVIGSGHTSAAGLDQHAQRIL
jgi:hypothetical protein